MPRRFDNARAELEVPEDLDDAAGIVIVEAYEAEEGRLVALSNPDVVDEPLPMASVDNLALLRESIGSRRGRTRRGRMRIEPGRLEHERL